MQTAKSFEHVTNRQGVQLADKARENGVSREEFKNFLNDPQRLQKFFNSLKLENLDWFEKLQIEAEKIDARLYLIPKLRVDYSKTHKEAAMTGGPQTGSDWNVLKVGDKYILPTNTTVDEVIILLNYPKGGGDYIKTGNWGIKNGLEKSVPHEVFAIGEQFPKLNYTLGPNPMYVVETTGCSFDGRAIACCVYWFDAKRLSFLGWQSDFGRGGAWFAFRKKISPKDLETSVS